LTPASVTMHVGDSSRGAPARVASASRSKRAHVPPPRWATLRPASVRHAPAVSPQPTSAQPLPDKRRADVGAANARRVGRRCPVLPELGGSLGVGLAAPPPSACRLPSSIALHGWGRMGAAGATADRTMLDFARRWASLPRRRYRPSPANRAASSVAPHASHWGARRGLRVRSRGSAGSHGTSAQRCGGWAQSAFAVAEMRPSLRVRASIQYLEKT